VTGTALVKTLPRCDRCHQALLWCSCSRELAPPATVEITALRGLWAVVVTCPHREFRAIFRPGLTREAMIREAARAATCNCLGVR
jgi:hypothetical protein